MVPPGCCGQPLVVPDEMVVNYVRVWQHPAPTVTTEGASEVQETSAQLNGQVNPNGTNTDYYFEYGPTTSYGTRIPAGEGMGLGSGTSSIHTSNAVSGLKPNTTYYYRLVATNIGGTIDGGGNSFTTTRLKADIVGEEPEGNGDCRYMAGLNAGSGTSFSWHPTNLTGMTCAKKIAVGEVNGDG